MERFGSRALLCLRRELSLVDSVPVLVAVDEYNHLFGSTKQFYDLKRIEPENLTVVKALRDLSRCATKPFTSTSASSSEDGGDGKGSAVNGGWLKRGVVIGSESNKHPFDSVKGMEYYQGPGINVREGNTPGKEALLLSLLLLRGQFSRILACVKLLRGAGGEKAAGSKAVVV